MLYNFILSLLFVPLVLCTDDITGNIYHESLQHIRRSQLYSLNSSMATTVQKLMRSISHDLTHSNVHDLYENQGQLVTTQCKMQLELMFQHANLSWATRMFDAFGKPGSGILQGNILWLGDYDECVETTGQTTSANNTNVTISGRYCLANLFFNNMRITIRLGTCFPSACQLLDIASLINSSIVANKWLSDQVTFLGLTCNQDSIKMEGKAIAAIVVLSLFGFFLLLGTLYDIFTSRAFFQPDPSLEMDNEKKMLILNKPVENGNSSCDKTNYERSNSKPAKNSTLRTVLIAFSLYTNTKKLFNTKVTPNTVHGLNGFRVLSLAWVILGHTFIFLAPSFRNAADVYNWLPKELSAQPLFNSFFSVDSFFFMSGLLVTYHLFTILYNDPAKLTSPWTWIMYYVHRYCRLTMFYMLIILIYLGLAPYWSKGPLAIPEPTDLNLCQKYWWTNLLYINNFWSLSENCLGWSWYLANDMQFHFIAPLILIPLYLFPFVGYLIIGAFLLVQFLYRGIMSSNIALPMNEDAIANEVMGRTEDMSDWMYYYTVPYSRIAPYLIGILTGYAIYRHKIKPIKLPKFVVIINWCFTVTAIFALLYCTYNEANGHFNSNSFNAFWNSINKTLWGLACAWIIYSTNVGHGGMAGEFLSWSGWTPLARLTYAAYLVHPIVISYTMANFRTSLYFETYTIVLQYISMWVMSYFFAYVTSLGMEVPLMGLEKLILRR